MNRRTTNRTRAIAGVAVALLLVAAPASAHITVHSDDAVRGAADVAVSFRVPNEQDDASTVKLQVFFPTATPLLGVLAQPHPGWSAAVRTTKLATPVKTDDGTITDAVSDVTWTAQTAADALRPGQSADFVVTAGKLPDVPMVTFKALQTYSNGDVVRWIEVAAPGAPEPDQPAPTLNLAAAAATTAPAAATPPAAASRPTGTDDLGRGLAIAALVVGLLALGVAAMRRRNVDADRPG